MLKRSLILSLLLFVLPQTGSADPAEKFVFNQTSLGKHLKALQKFSILAARNAVINHGTFRPFGVSLDVNGIYKTHFGKGEDTVADLKMIMDQFKKIAKKGNIVAATILYDTRISRRYDKQQFDAIYITTDSHLSGTKNGYILYRKNTLGKFSFSTIISNKKDTTSIFP